MSSENTDSPTLNIHINKRCMTELLLLDNVNVLRLFDTGSTVNIISESLMKSSEYLSSIKAMVSGTHKIRNMTGETIANIFIEICFKVKDDYILHTTALIVPDFGSIKFILSTTSMIQLNNVIDAANQKIYIRKKSFVFKTTNPCRIKANDSTTLLIKCALPKSLRNGDFISKAFRLFIMFLPSNILLKFRKGQSYIKLSNHTSKAISIKGNTALGCASFDLINDVSNRVTHFHTDLDGSLAFCSREISDCPIQDGISSRLKTNNHFTYYNDYQGNSFRHM